MLSRDAGFAFSSIIDTASLNWQSIGQISVIELGCGCGIVGLSLSQMVENVTVIMTDLPEHQDIVARNIALMKPASSSKAIFLPLPWGTPVTKDISSRKYDLIIAADCTYNPDSSPDLVQTLSELSKGSPEAFVVVAMKVRHLGEVIFFDLMKNAGFRSVGSRVYDLPMEKHLEEERVEFHVFGFLTDNLEEWKLKGLLKEIWKAIDPAKPIQSNETTHGKD
jgi:predicted nicotinamide N-methyase